MVHIRRNLFVVLRQFGDRCFAIKKIWDAFSKWWHIYNWNCEFSGDIKIAQSHWKRKFAAMYLFCQL